MKSLLSAATAGLALAAAPTWTELTPEYSYEAWLADFAPRHPGTKEAFAANLARILAHNADPSQTWKAGVNQWTGLTRQEFGERIRGFKRGAKPLGAAKLAHDASRDAPVSALPASLDWREKGVVTKVKDQGQCGGCWTFSTSETLESHIAINTGKLMTFSEQALIDCVPNPDQCGGTGGCSGATQELAFNWTIGAGITTEASYPYTAVTGTCDMAKVVPVATITGYAELPPNNYSALMNQVNRLPVAISAAAEPWQIYEGGVFSSECGTDVDHAIVLVGYGTDTSGAKPMDYWLVRNSWGEGWGEKGYIKIRRYGSTEKGEPCGTDTTPGDGDGCKGGPASIQVCGLCGILSDSSYPIGGKLA